MSSDLVYVYIALFVFLSSNGGCKASCGVPNVFITICDHYLTFNSFVDWINQDFDDQLINNCTEYIILIKH